MLIFIEFIQFCSYDQLVDLEQSMEEGYEENGRGQKEKMGSFMDVAEKVLLFSIVLNYNSIYRP